MSAPAGSSVTTKVSGRTCSAKTFISMKGQSFRGNKSLVDNGIPPAPSFGHRRASVPRLLPFMRWHSARSGARFTYGLNTHVGMGPACLCYGVWIMRTGVIAKKVGMTRLFQEDGRHVPVTVQLDHASY